MHRFLKVPAAAAARHSLDRAEGYQWLLSDRSDDQSDDFNGSFDDRLTEHRGQAHIGIECRINGLSSPVRKSTVTRSAARRDNNSNSQPCREPVSVDCLAVLNIFFLSSSIEF